MEGRGGESCSFCKWVTKNFVRQEKRTVISRWKRDRVQEIVGGSSGTNKAGHLVKGSISTRYLDEIPESKSGKKKEQWTKMKPGKMSQDSCLGS